MRDILLQTFFVRANFLTTDRYFSAYGRPLEMVTSFKCLGRVISDTDDE